MAITDSGELKSATSTHPTSAVATITGVAGKTLYITGISGSSDKAGGIILLKDGTTVIWQDRISNTSGYVCPFNPALRITAGANASTTVDGTANCQSNLIGVIL